MRCLYCGKGLAFLKRWTGGGEFCSDAHRQRYQEEYNQLALNRLLQANAPVEGGAGDEGKPQKETKPETKPEAKPDTVKQAVTIEREPAPILKPSAPVPPAAPAAAASVRIAAPPIRQEPIPSVTVEQRPAAAAPAQPVAVQEIAPEPQITPEQQPEEPAPAPMAGFFVELPVPVAVQTMAMSAPELKLVYWGEPALPGRNFVTSGEIEVPMAGHVALPAFFRGIDCATHPREKNFELREFVRSAPIVEVSLRPAAETMLDIAGEPLEILVGPHPPPESPLLWHEPERAFAPCVLELGEWARLDFETTGLPEAATEEGSARAVSNSEAAKSVVPAREDIPPPAPRVNMVVLESAALFAPKPPAPEPVVVALPDETLEKLPGSKLKLLPEIVTKPMPLTLHGLAAGKAKPVQVFASAASSGVAVLAPRSDGLPLRPVMTLGPMPVAPAAKAPLPVRSEPVKTTVSDPRFANGLLRKPEARIAETERREAERRDTVKREVERRQAERRQPEKREAEKTAAPAAVATEVKKPAVETRPVAKSVAGAKPADIKPAEKPVAAAPEPAPRAAAKQAKIPAPLAAPYLETDLRLPQLQLTTSGSFLSKLPVAVKAGVAIAILLGIGGGIYFAKGTGKTVKPVSHTMEVGAVLPMGAAGWSADFAPDPAGGRKRQVSVLTGSLSLTNYRLDLEGQIDNNAFGWVFRAANAKNFYVGKLEIVRPGLNPSVDFVRFAVIDGVEQSRTHIPLRMPLKVDTLYKIRVEAVGDRLSTWVQDQKVDEWTESHISAGGVGLYNERGERGTLKGDLSVASLVMK